MIHQQIQLLYKFSLELCTCKHGKLEIVYNNIFPSAVIFYRLFDKLVAPVFICFLAVERDHLRFCKLLRKVPNCTTNEMAYGELGRFPMLINRILKHWLRIVNGKACPMVKHVFRPWARTTHHAPPSPTFHPHQLFFKP